MTLVRKSLITVFLTIGFIAIVAFGVIRLVIPSPPPAFTSQSATILSKPLTSRLALIVVDGLRYTTATNPSLMPYFAQRMEKHTSGEIWAGPVSMTSSAVFAYGTGQFGTIDHIVHNETAKPTFFNHLIENARSAGLTTSCTGDHGWFSMYPGAWNYEYPDPPGVAIDVDYNDEIFKASYDFLNKQPPPNFMVFHFVTPDHQAHAYGSNSDRYQKHIAHFDELLEQFLKTIPQNVTVFVTSDHGATDSGTHGSDTPMQRRSPIFAYGPGLVDGYKEHRILSQPELPNTFATLLGIAVPAQSLGRTLVEWLDISNDAKENILCRDVFRLQKYVSSLGHVTELISCETPIPTIEQSTSQYVTTLASVQSEQGSTSKYGWFIPCITIAGAIAIAWFISRNRFRIRQKLSWAILVSVISISSSFAVLYLERVSSQYSMWMYILGNCIILLIVIRILKFQTWIEQFPSIAIGLASILASSHLRATQPESLIIVVVIALLAMTIGIPVTRSWRAAYQNSTWSNIMPNVALIAIISPAGVSSDNFFSGITSHSWSGPLVASVSAIAIWYFIEYKSDKSTPNSAAHFEFLLAILAAIALKRFAPAWICLTGWALSFATIALGFIQKNKRIILFGMVLSYAWVSRDFEWPFVSGGYIVSHWMGSIVSRNSSNSSLRSDAYPITVFLCVIFLFSWSYIQCIGVQLGIDFTRLDFGAGAFRQPGASLFRIIAAVVLKHSLARLLALWPFVFALHQPLRRHVTEGLLILELIRVGAMVTMLYVCKTSFWTSFRVLADIPQSLIAALVVAILFAILAFFQREHVIMANTKPSC